MHVTQLHKNRVIKRHYRLLKRYYRNATISLKNFFFFFFKLDFEKVDFQKMGIFLISLGNGVECYLFCPKRAEANFVLVLNVLCFISHNTFESTI